MCTICALFCNLVLQIGDDYFNCALHAKPCLGSAPALTMPCGVDAKVRTLCDMQHVCLHVVQHMLEQVDIHSSLKQEG